MRFSKKLAVAAVSTVAAVAVATSAFAYWSTNGTGTGSASTGTASADAIKVNQVGSLTTMYPGDSAQALTFNLQNQDLNQNLHVAGVSVAVTDVTKGVDAQQKPISIFGVCGASNFSISQPVAATVAREVNAHSTSDTISSGSIHFNDQASTDQNACQGASVVLTYTAS